MPRLLTLLCLGFLMTAATGPAIDFLGKPYHPGAFTTKPHPMWEFVAGQETVQNWTTLLTVIERSDAHSLQDLDRLSEGVKSNYEAHQAKIVLARTMHDSSGATFNYMVVAFNEVASHRYELDFVKIGQGPKTGYVAVYGVRITGPNYVAKASAFLTQHSGEIGIALEKLVLPDLGTLPRKEF